MCVCVCVCVCVYRYTIFNVKLLMATELGLYLNLCIKVGQTCSPNLLAISSNIW